MKSQLGAGSIKLRGRFSKLLSCGCCDVKNFKPSYETRLAEKEIAKFDVSSFQSERIAKMAFDSVFSDVLHHETPQKRYQALLAAG